MYAAGERNVLTLHFAGSLLRRPVCCLAVCYSQQIMAVIAIVMWPWLGVCVYLWSVDRGGDI